MKDFFDYTDDALGRVIVGKKAKHNRGHWKGNDKKVYKLIFDNISFGKIRDHLNVDYHTFYFKEYPMTIVEFYFYYIEYNDKIEEMIARELGVNKEKIESIDRIIVGIFIGFECRITNMGYILRRRFNRYIRWMRECVCSGQENFDEKEFSDRFFQQTAETEENIKAVNDVCYSYSSRDCRWGIRLKENGELLSDIVKRYARPEIFALVDADPDFGMPIGYDSYISMFLLLETILLEFECQI